MKSHNILNNHLHYYQNQIKKKYTYKTNKYTLNIYLAVVLMIEQNKSLILKIIMKFLVN